MSPFRFGRDVEMCMKRLFTVDEVAEQLGICRRQVQYHLADGTIASVNVGRGSVRATPRIRDVEIERFVERGNAMPTQAAAPVQDSYEARYAARSASKSRRGR